MAAQLATLAASLALTGLPIAAAADTAATPAAGDTIVVVGRGTEQRLFDTPYAAGVVDAATLRAAGPMVNLSEAMSRVPGLVVNLRHNYAQDLQISSRGFGARASFGVRGLRLVADGIPASGPDGQGQVSHVDLAGADRVEVLRGPFSALYGASSGGAIVVVGRAPRQASFELAGDAGSDGLRQLRLALALPLSGTLGPGWSLRAGVSGFETQGLRPQAQARRSSAHLRLERNRLDEEGQRLVMVANTLDLPAQDPLGLTRAQFDADPFQTAPQATQFDTRKDTRQTQAGMQWQRRLAAGPLERGEVALYAGRRAVTQFQAIASTTQAPVRHPGGLIDFTREYGGIDARLGWRLGPLALTTGLAADQQRELRRGFENYTGTGAAQVLGVPGRLRRDEINRVQGRDAYVQAELPLGDTVAASGGWRRTRITLRSDDRFLGNGDDSGALAYTGTLPVLGLRWQPAPAWSLHLSAGRGFEAPTLNEVSYRPDNGSGFNTGLAAQRSRQVELGAKWRGAAASAELAIFEARSDDEIAVQSNAGGRSTFRNVGRTSRRGAELSARAALGSGWQMTLAATRLDARYRDAFLACAGVPCTAPSVPVPAGGRIAGTVPALGFAELVRRAGPWEYGLELRGQGRQPVDDRNSDFAAGHGLAALRVMHRWAMAGGELETLLRLDNLADRRVAGSVIVNEGNQRFFEPATGRSVLLALRWRQGI